MSDQACIRCGYPFAPGVSICSECGLERAQSARLGLTGARRDIFAIEWLLVTVAGGAALVRGAGLRARRRDAGRGADTRTTVSSLLR